MNRTITDQGVVDANAINISGRQRMLSQRILLLSVEMVATTDADSQALTDAIDLFEASHDMLLANIQMSPQLQTHYFAGPDALDPQVRGFIRLARQLTTGVPATRRDIVRRMSDLGRDGLLRSLDQAVQFIESQSHENVAGLSRTQKTVLGISIAVLLFEAVFIFWPAQISVRSTIVKLREQTLSLKTSQRDLQDMNDRLHHIAHHDALTGLPNRVGLTTHLNDRIRQSPVMEFSVLLLDLDQFKAINDTAGHAVGDGLLIAVGGMLRLCIDEDDFIARMGGDEFLLVTTEPPETLAKRMQQTLAAPIEVLGRNCLASPSIGYATLQRSAEDPLELLADANIALNAAKDAGRNRIQAFVPDMRRAAENTQALQSELRDAIDSGQIEPWFQPQINLADGTLQGAEVLARWRHPTRGLLTPDTFLPLADRAGLTIDLDHAIWQVALKNVRCWQDAQLWQASVSLNAAPDTIADPYLVERLLNQMHRTGCDASQVVIEVLETTLIDGSDDMAAINIDSIAECGIALELDDFGTGYASLSKLTQLPLTGIKLDRSLIAPLPDAGADSVVRAILALAAELGLQVVAEGVETEAQAQHLHERGCKLAQGYGFARPMPAADFATWLAKSANHPAPQHNQQALRA